MARRKRRQREKNKKSKTGKTEETPTEENEKPTFADEVVPLTLIKSSSKIKSFDFKSALNKDGSFNVIYLFYI